MARWYSHLYPHDERISSLMEACERYNNRERLSRQYIDNVLRDAKEAKSDRFGRFNDAYCAADTVLKLAGLLFNYDVFDVDYRIAATASFSCYAKSKHDCEMIARREVLAAMREFWKIKEPDH